jgi:hypothetical protein
VKYKFAVQSTHNAHFHPDDHLFSTESCHTTLNAAKKQYDRQMGAMREICGPTAWNRNYRIIALADIPMTTRLECHGSQCGYHSEICPTCAQATVNWTWPEGSTQPFIYVPQIDAHDGEIALPDGWDSPHQCSKCRIHEREMENAEFQSAKSSQ